MASTVEYTRGTSFTDAQAASPGTPPSGPALDREFDRLKISTDSLSQSLDLIQQDDGRLKTASVGYDQIDPAVYTGLKPAEVWVTGKNFTVNTAVFYDNGATLNLYRCLVGHTSGTFDVDLAASKWLFLANYTPPAVVGTIGIANGGTGQTTAAAAWTALGGGAAGKFDIVPVANGGTGGTTIAALKALVGAVPWSSRTVTDNATLTVADANSIIFADTTAGQVTLTLPAVAAMGTTSPPIWFVRTGTGSNILRLDSAGSETIQGGLTFDVQNKWDAAVLWCNGTEWVVAASQYSTTGYSKTLLNKNDAPSWRTQLGLAIGTDVQAFDSDLTQIAGILRSRGDLIVGGASSWQRLALGASGTFLQSDGTDVVFGAAPVGVTTLGTLTFSAESTKTLSSLVLTGYKYISLEFGGITNSLAGNITVNGVNVQTLSTTAAQKGRYLIELVNGISFGAIAGSLPVNVSPWLSDTTLNNASTSITVAVSAGNLTGSVIVNGIR